MKRIIKEIVLKGNKGTSISLGLGYSGNRKFRKVEEAFQPDYVRVFTDTDKDGNKVKVIIIRIGDVFWKHVPVEGVDPYELAEKVRKMAKYNAGRAIWYLRRNSIAYERSDGRETQDIRKARLSRDSVVGEHQKRRRK